uniref:Uncharacterized protein n=1 Tax=Arundo donax TaxID=35708 RepID=A0A0A9HNW9_ARUDO
MPEEAPVTSTTLPRRSSPLAKGLTSNRATRRQMKAMGR